MKKTIVALIIVSMIAILIAYRKPIGKFLAGEKTADDKEDNMHSKVKAAMIVAAEQVNEKAKKAAEALTAIEKKIEEKAAEEAQKADEKPVAPETTEQPDKPTEDADLAYDEETMIIRAYGKIYRIPDAESMSNIQRSLIEGFKYLSDGTASVGNPLNPICTAGKVVKECVDSAALEKYARLVDDMVEADTSIQKNGITGKLNHPTAVAFAETVKIMPTVIEKYRVA